MASSHDSPIAFIRYYCEPPTCLVYSQHVTFPPE
jgi:hypothetical protein